MRRSIEGLSTGTHLLDGMPAVFHSDDFMVRFMDGFDDVLAPVHAVVRDLDAYFDPAICPTDFLEWLASWLGVSLNQRWPLQRRRQLMQRAVDVHRMRGTLWGVSAAVELYTGIVPEVEDSGACTSSADPGAAAEGSRALGLSVTVRTDRDDVSADVIERIVANAKPAHVPHQVRVIVER